MPVTKSWGAAGFHGQRIESCTRYRGLHESLSPLFGIEIVFRETFLEPMLIPIPIPIQAETRKLSKRLCPALRTDLTIESIMPKYTVITLGCKVNQYESAGLEENLKSRGWSSVSTGEAADLCIVNTCTVTGKASMQARQAIRRAVRSHHGARVVVTGCYAQTEPDTLAEIEGVTAVIGQADKDIIPELIDNAIQSGKSNLESRHTDIRRVKTFDSLPVSGFDHRTRPFLKIQDGCNAFCSYCIVPHARGRSRSMVVQEVLDKLLRLDAGGYHEVVLTGIHLGCYGQDHSPQTDLLQILLKIEASDFKGRIRLSSIEPLELTDDIIHLVGRSPKFCRHFHIPLQSGDDQILARMKRPYNADLFRNRVERIVTNVPDAAIGVDTLIGFPGEDQAAFENTFQMIRDLPVAYLHVFPYSRRKGTPAYDYPDQLAPDIVKRRCDRIRSIGREKRAAFYRRGIGGTMKVLVESQRDAKTGLLKGFTSNYIPVLLDGKDSLKEQLVKVTLDAIDNNLFVYGKLIQ